MRHLRPMRYVDEVARLGSIRRAAERLNVTPSAINRRIADLEEELGTLLFERLPRGMRPTAAGELLLRHIRAQAAELETVHSHIEDLRGLRRGTIRLACSQALAHGLVGDAVAAFRAKAPLVRFAVTVCGHEAALALLDSYEVDLVLIVGTARAAHVLTLASAEQSLVAVMRADHRFAARPVVRLRDLEGEALVLPDRSLLGRRILDTALDRRRSRAAPVVESNSFDLLWQVVRREGAVSVQFALGAPSGEEARDRGLVARPLDPGDAPPATVVLGQLRDRTLPVAAARFAEMVAAMLSSVGVAPGTA